MGTKNQKAPQRKSVNAKRARQQHNLKYAATLASIFKRLGRASVEISSSGVSPLEVAIAGPDGEISRDNDIVRRMAKQAGVQCPKLEPFSGAKRGPTHKLGKIEGLRLKAEAIEKGKEPILLTAFLQAGTHIRAGFANVLPAGTKASHFMGDERLTIAALRGSLQNLQGFTPAKEEQSYLVTGALSPNTKQKGGYFPRPIGGEYTFTNSAILHMNVKNKMGPQFQKTSDFPHDFRYRSVLFPLSGSQDVAFVDTFAKAQIGQSPVQSPGKIPTTGPAIDISSAIGKILTPGDVMSYRPSTSKSFFVSNYKVTLCSVDSDHEFKYADSEYKVQIKRQMAVAEVKNSFGSPYHIPMFEEAVIYIQKRVNSIYLNTEASLVLSATPHLNGDTRPAEQHLHVLGDNAFTLSLPSSMPQLGDRHESSMRNIGSVMKTLNKVRLLPKLDPAMQTTLEEMFGFVNATDDIKTHYDGIINKQRKQSEVETIDADEKTAKVERHKDATITNSERLSKSFLTNQLNKRILAPGGTPLVQVKHWIVSATFSFIVIQGVDTSITHGFIQTYLPGMLEWPNNIEKTRESTTFTGLVSADKGAYSRGNPTLDPIPAPVSVAKILRNGHAAPAGSELRGQYRSALPPELERELALL